MPFTLVSFHAHPDDEALLTGGTLARAAAEGHRVVLVTATDGEAGLAAAERTGDLGAARAAELDQAAAALGCARVVRLGHADSGWGSSPARAAGPGFSELPVEDVARQLAAVLREEGAHVLTSYDPAGGYGHPDHVQVHRVGARAAELAATPLLLEATVDRTLVRRGLRLARLVPRLDSDVLAQRLDTAFTAREDLTHRVDVRAHLAAKREALAAHASQTESDSGLRGIRLLLRLPRPVFSALLGREWFRQSGRGRVPGRLLDDVFAGLG
ncbi:PIG-L family deacetylase [Kineococcus xinjiangensis]|uniref:PIG-L family deacetylase n=1 Tax=Kineococcus xinjiangensis TaxID=512762 RepID=UPI001B803509|nr:PIG-L family deacetylase [Kineococcus xinjiangensis]